MTQDWQIKGRAECCSVSGKPFQEGEYFYTLLFDGKEGFERQDWSEEAWAQRDETVKPFSFWRTKFEPPPPPEPEALTKQTAEDLLRKYMEEQTPQHANARYILALMLERKRFLKQVDAKHSDEGRLLIYEHTKTGETFLIPDPQLRLDQIESVQMEIAGLLA